MIIHNVRQGSNEWKQLRAGIPTASCFDKIITKKGAPSDSSEKYLHQLLAERVMGKPVESGKSFWTIRGSNLEAEALRFYRFQQDEELKPVGFVTNDKGDRGASPDHFVGATGSLEIKCPSEAEHMSYMLQEGAHYDTYKVQVQGQLYVCEKEWCDVLSYHPELPMALARIHRDEDFIQKIDKALNTFCDRLAARYQDLVDRRIVSGAPGNSAGGVSQPGSTPTVAPKAPDFLQTLKDSLTAVEARRQA